MLDRKLEKAVDLKIGEQKKFVAWWDANVAVGQGTRTELCRDLGKVHWEEAEHLTGMKQQRVSDLGGMTKEELLAGEKFLSSAIPSRGRKK
jgi:hypothetical protein